MTLSAQQLELRKQGIGASEIAAAAGISRWETPYELWEHKVGIAPAKTQTEAMEIGIEIEGFIANWACRKRSLIVFDADPPTVQHPDHPWAMATPDRLILNSPDSDVEILECKNVGVYSLKYWDDSKADGIPVYVLAQIQWQMFCTGHHHCYVAAFLAGGQRRVWEFDYDEKLTAKLFTIAEKFWNYNVLQEIPPGEHGELLTVEYTAEDGLLNSTPELLDLAKERLRLFTNRKADKVKLDEIDNVFKAVIGDMLGISEIATYKPDKHGKRRFRFNYGGE